MQVRISNDQSHIFWEEVVFTIALMIMGIVFMIAAATIDLHEDTGLTARSLPMLVSVIITFYSVVKATSLLRLAYYHRFPMIGAEGITVKIILPLSLTMIVYVSLVMALGYAIGTAFILMIVLWIFNIRELFLNFMLSVIVATISNYVFVDTLGLFMPTGWLIESIQKLL
jgi:hypothetical protein